MFFTESNLDVFSLMLHFQEVAQYECLRHIGDNMFQFGEL